MFQITIIGMYLALTQKLDIILPDDTCVLVLEDAMARSQRKFVRLPYDFSFNGILLGRVIM